MQPWIRARLKTLKDEFGTSEFTMEDTKKILASKFRDKEEKILVLFSKLKDEGKINVRMDPLDSRKRIYRITDESLTVKSGDLTRGDLESLLKEAADLIRTRVDYSFILLLLFYKRISDRWIAEYDAAYQKAVKEYDLSPKEADEEARHDVYHDFVIDREHLWDNVRKETTGLAEKFSKAMKKIGENNPQLKDVFQNFDFHQFAGNRENEEVLRQLVELFSSHSLQTVAPDMLGDAYEWILRYFAPQKAKEGEVYTAREVIKLLVEFLDPKANETVYDPASGSGGMLIISHQHVKERYGDEAAKTILLHGQEVNFRTRALAKMNLYLHGIKNASAEYGDAILYPKFKEGDTFKRFDVVIANPPWNQDAYGEQTVKKGEYVRERFPYGFGPDQSADWLWIQHMLASAKEDTGRVGVVIDNGALFRGGKEKAIRRAMVEAGKIEAVILLPEKLFYNTGAPGSILILRHKMPSKRKGKILFINASKEFEQHPDVRRLNRLGDKNILNILKAREKGEVEGLSRYVGIEEIAENDFNLNVTLYVYEHDAGEEVDIRAEWEKLRMLQREQEGIDRKIGEYLRELGYTDENRLLR